MRECGFCGQQHETTMAGPFPVVLCPNLPDGWTTVGYPGEDQIIVDTGDR